MTLPSSEFGSTDAAGADALAPPDDDAGAEAAGADVAPGAALHAARMSITTATNAAIREYLCISPPRVDRTAPGDAGAFTSLAPDASRSGGSSLSHTCAIVNGFAAAFAAPIEPRYRSDLAIRSAASRPSDVSRRYVMPSFDHSSASPTQR